MRFVAISRWGSLGPKAMADRTGFRNIGIALVAIWLAIVAYSVLYQLSGYLTIHGFAFRPWAQIRGTTLYFWTPWVLLAPVVWYLAHRFPIRPGRRLEPVAQHFVLMTCLSIAHAYVAAMVYYYIGDLDPGMQDYAAWQHTGHFLFLDDMYLMDCFVYSVLIASVSMKRFYELARQRELDFERSNTQLAESRLQTLRMQVNPHFLFNTLNSIAVLIRKQDNAAAEVMLTRLSDFFRLTLELGREQLVTIREELALIEQYLEIEKVRFSDRLAVEYRVDGACLDEPVPVLLLQPLVENAIKHGMRRKRGLCHICIEVARESDLMRIGVTDDGAGSQQSAAVSTGVGLGNVKSRLLAIYAGRAGFSFASAPGQGARVTILLPLADAVALPA